MRQVMTRRTSCLALDILQSNVDTMQCASDTVQRKPGTVQCIFDRSTTGVCNPVAYVLYIATVFKRFGRGCKP